MTANDWLSLVIVIVCLLLSAFFAGSETALTASSRASMARLEKQGNKGAAIVNRLLEQRERLIGALLLGNNAVNIAASALATGILLAWFGSAGVVYATVMMTLLVVVFSEVLPKTAAFNAPDRVALLVARPMQWIVRLLGPVLMGIEALDKVLTSLGNKIDHVVSIDVDEEALVTRLTGRRTCKNAACGQMFHIKFTPAKKEGVCDKCGSELYQRDDDNETTVRSRLATYNQATAPLIGYYKTKGLVRPIAGVGSIDDIFNKIVGIVSGGHTCACGR